MANHVTATQHSLTDAPPMAKTSVQQSLLHLKSSNRHDEAASLHWGKHDLDLVCYCAVLQPVSILRRTHLTTVSVSESSPGGLGGYGVLHVPRKYLYVFWIKQTPEEVPACVAAGLSNSDGINYCEGFINHPRLNVTKNDHTFCLFLSDVQQSDIATYFCGAYLFNRLFFGNGTRLILEDKTNESEFSGTIISNIKSGTGSMFHYTVLVSVVTNTISIIVIGVLIFHWTQKWKLCSGADPLSATAGNMDHQHAYVMKSKDLGFSHSRS